MEAHEQIRKFEEFFEENFKEKIIQNIGKDKRYLEIDFSELTIFDPQLSDDLLENPEEVIKAAEIAIEQFDTLGDVKNLKIRFYNLPKSLRRYVWNIRGADVGKFIAIEANISKITGLLHFAVSARFECPACGNIINVLFQDREFKEVTRCGCGRKGKFRLLHKEMIDTIKIGMQDDLLAEENKNRAIAMEKVAILEGDLASKEKDLLIKPGKKIIANGYLEYRRKDKVSSEFISLFIVNSIEFIKIGWDTVKIKPEEEKKIIGLSKEKDIISRLANSISDMQGNDEIKIANILQLAGAPHLYDKNGILSSRGTIHILVVGDSGTNKTFHAKRAGNISPIYSFQSAANASGKGLVSAVQQDKELGTWVLIPGVVAMCNGGLCVIDEIDKTNAEDYGDHNNAMNDMKVYVAKASVKGVLDTETSYLSTANPKNREFVATGYDNKYQQIDMPKDFLDRYDIIFAIETPYEKEKKDKIMDVMLERHLEDNEIDGSELWKPEFTHEFLRKYISSCRKAKPRPIFKKEFISKVKENMYNLMKPISGEQIKISNRQIETIMRWSYASARLRRRDVTEEDILLAFKIKKKSFEQLGILTDKGYSWVVEEKIDFKEISIVDAVKAAFKEIESRVGKIVPIDDIVAICKDKGIEEDDVENTINKIKRSGDYFEPRRGFLSKI